MCFLLYISSDAEIPEIPWDESAPGLATQKLDVYESAVVAQLSGRFVKFVTSEQGCSCGYRSVSFSEWSALGSAAGRAERGEGVKIHAALSTFVAMLRARGQSVSLYGCWDGEFTEPAAGTEEISAQALAAPEFFFRERIRYDVLG